MKIIYITYDALCTYYLNFNEVKNVLKKFENALKTPKNDPTTFCN